MTPNSNCSGYAIRNSGYGVLFSEWWPGQKGGSVMKAGVGPCWEKEFHWLGEWERGMGGELTKIYHIHE